MTTLLPQNPGFPIVSEMRNPYLPQPPLEEPAGGFEKSFAEFLAGLDRRETEERSLRDRGIRAREEAADSPPPEPEGEGPAGPGALYGSAGAEDRKAVQPEAKAGEGRALHENAGDRETAFRREIRAPGTPRDEPSGAGSAREGEDPGEPRLWGASLFQSPYYAYQAPAGAGAEKGPPEDAGPEAPVPPGRAEAFAAAPARKGLKAGASPGWKEGAETAGPGNSALEEQRIPEKEMPASPAGEERLPAGIPRDGEGRAGPEYREKRAAGLPVPAPAGPEEPAGALSRLPLSPRQGEAGEERPREGRGNSRRRVELRDHRERVPEEPLSPPPSRPVTGGAPEIPFRDLISLDLDPRRAGERALQNKGDAGTFEEVLARELRQHLNSDIVQRAQVILRDRGEGIIRLSLRPESLGHVKIRLELTENKIAGRIIVESGEALRAFEREIGSLEQAFRDSGYESAELSAFLAQDGQGSGTYQGEEKPFYSPGLAGEAASRYDEADETRERTDTSFPDLSGNGFGPGNRHIQVNILI